MSVGSPRTHSCVASFLGRDWWSWFGCCRVVNSSGLSVSAISEADDVALGLATGVCGVPREAGLRSETLRRGRRTPGGGCTLTPGSPDRQFTDIHGPLPMIQESVVRCNGVVHLSVLSCLSGGTLLLTAERRWWCRYACHPIDAEILCPSVSLLSVLPPRHTPCFQKPSGCVCMFMFKLLTFLVCEQRLLSRGACAACTNVRSSTHYEVIIKAQYRFPKYFRWRRNLSWAFIWHTLLVSRLASRTQPRNQSINALVGIAARSSIKTMYIQRQYNKT